MPHYEMPRASLLHVQMHMTHTQFRKYMTLIRSAAKKHLNCGLRPEEQDQDSLVPAKSLQKDMKGNLSQELFWRLQEVIQKHCKESFMIQISDSESDPENEADIIAPQHHLLPPLLT
ncbi:hypothetical protein EDD16DRAFT_1528350 [Pisolithus croceorrhizus]|nr:hypothetical protein EV401DRAFT_1895945 [Pisolithus croceorrhizus]KAI6095897.1 hypothetical protein EDD16DRAFT_1528350 [Pisolithus croceorrhizus]KAI6152698.1 hypothetical protein EDD17DRAFT_1513267 [Pisolithus thermaeus]